MYVSGQILPERLAALIQTALFIKGTSASADELLELILRSGMQAADSAAGALFLADETLQKAETVVFAYDETFYRAESDRQLPAAVTWVLQQKEPLRLNNPEADNRFTSNGMIDTPYHSEGFIAVPLCVNDSCIGVLEAVRKNGGGDFSEADLSLLGIVAGYAAAVYRTSCAYRLYEASIPYHEHNAVLLSEKEPFIAASPVMREKLEICKRLASSDVPILIVGERGVGKALFAKQLHLYSHRSTQPFIHVNCAEPSAALLERRLFGGAAVGLNGGAEDCFNLAEGGTLFLDGVAAFPLSLQKKLLEKLSQLEQRDRTIRLIASTTGDIERLTREGSFLSDLYGKLNVLPLYIPPLRQRKEDIGALAGVFLRRFSREVRKSFTGFTGDAQSALQNAGWKENVRELKNIVEYACLTGTPPLVTADDLFPRYLRADFSADGACNLKSAVDAFKRSYIRATLEKTGGNQTAAASILEIQRTYLSRLMKELEIRNYNDVKL